MNYDLGKLVDCFNKLDSRVMEIRTDKNSVYLYIDDKLITNDYYNLKTRVMQILRENAYHYYLEN